MVSRRRIIKGLPVRKVRISLDVVTASAVDAMVERDGVSFSRALCALATAAAVTDPELMAAIKATMQTVVLKIIAAKGWHPGLSEEIAKEVTNHE